MTCSTSRVCLTLRLAGDLLAEVFCDARVDWNLPGVRPLGPDIAVFRDVAERRNWKTFDVAAEGARPEVVVEVTSPDTRKNDVEDKFDFYRRAKVPLYVIADGIQDDEHGRKLELKAYRRTRGGVTSRFGRTLGAGSGSTWSACGWG